MMIKIIAAIAQTPKVFRKMAFSIGKKTAIIIIKTLKMIMLFILIIK